jgi:hypothetical protein
MKIFAVMLGIAFITPALPAQDHNRNSQNSPSGRYYDRQNKDWHEWNDTENQAYQRYQQENHRQNQDFKRLPRKQQDSYFQWRHQHQDNQRSENQRER